MKLEQLQELFTNSILTGDYQEELVKIITPGGKLTAMQALQVYRNDYLSRMFDSIENVYQVTSRLLDKEDFATLVSFYLKDNFSESHDVSCIGNNFPHFLRTHSILEECPFLAELAELEKNFEKLFHKKSQTGLTALDFSKINAIENKKLIFTDACFSYNSPYPLYDIWSEAEEFSEHGDIRIFYKNKEGIKSKELNSFQYFLWQKLENGDSLSRAIDELQKIKDEKTLENADLSIADMFAFLSSEELIIEVIA